MQDDAFSHLDVNAMSAIPEDPEFPDWEVSDSLSTCMVDFSVTLIGSRHSGTECTHSIDHIATGMWQISIT